jgi:hypothetical protein
MNALVSYRNGYRGQEGDVDADDSVKTVSYQHRTIPTERPPFCAKSSLTFSDRGESRGERNGSLRPLFSAF